MLVITVFDLILIFLSILGKSTFQAMLPALVINLIILIYCLTPGVKAAFAPPARPVTTPAAPAAARTMEAPPPPAAAPPAMRAAAIPLEPPIEAPAAIAPVELQAEEPQAPPAEEILADAPAASPVELPGEARASAPVEFPTEEPAAPAPKEARQRHRVDIETIEGIGPTYAAILKGIGVLTVAELLTEGASRKGREDLVEKTGVSAKLILKWVNMADLMRISGVGEEYSELLEVAGVDTVKELKLRNPENLHQAMQQVNEQRKLVRRLPHLSEVQDWVEQAKLLEAVITY